MAKKLLASIFAFFSALGLVKAQKTITLPYTYTSSTGKYILAAYPGNIFKLSYQPNGYTTNEYISDAVILKPLAATKAAVKTSGNSVTITLGKNSFSFSGDQVSVNGGLVNLIAPFQKDEFRGFRFRLNPAERFYGGGSRALPLNRRGHKFNLYNGPWYGYGEGANNLNYSVPFVSSSAGYGLFFDNVSKGYMDIASEDKDVLEYGAFSGELNCYLVFGNSQKEILAGYHRLTGNQPLPPKWALGNLMSRFGYASEAQARDIVAQMQQHNIPLDAIIFDLFWFGDSIKNTIGNLDWVNKAKWPNPARMMADFKADGINTVLITEPYILKTSSTYDESKHLHAVDSAGKPYVLTEFYFGNGGLLDLFRKDAQQWFWNKHKPQLKIGVEGWWGDLGEPETHPAAIHHNLKDLGFKRLFKANEVHNLYGHTWTKFLYQRYQRELPNKRLFSLNRSGFAGTQRYSIFPWSGDVSRSWSGLRAQLPVMLGMSMSGVPYMHADAGGFAGGEGDNELYTRWLQFAVFTPIFRPHGTALYEIDPLAFSYPSEPALFPEPYRSIARKAVEWRYRLLPYNYTLAYQQAAAGAPLVAPLYYHFPGDAKAADVEDQYMWGEYILVAPVLNKGQQQRPVYLPAGYWYSWNSSTRLAGDTTINVQLAQDNIPVFVRAGALIPLTDADSIRNTRDAGSTQLAVHYYPSTSTSEYALYEDDGSSANAISSRQFELMSIKATPTKSGYQFSVSSNGGTFKNRPAKRQMKLVVHSGGHKSVMINGKDVTAKSVLSQDKTTIPFVFTSSRVTIVLN